MSNTHILLVGFFLSQGINRISRRHELNVVDLAIVMNPGPCHTFCNVLSAISNSANVVSSLDSDDGTFLRCDICEGEELTVEVQEDISKKLGKELPQGFVHRGAAQQQQLPQNHLSGGPFGYVYALSGQEQYIN